MTTILVRKVPEELRKAFKLLCLQRNTTMQAEIQRLMTEELDRARKEERGK